MDWSKVLPAGDPPADSVEQQNIWVRDAFNSLWKSLVDDTIDALAPSVETSSPGSMFVEDKSIVVNPPFLLGGKCSSPSENADLLNHPILQQITDRLTNVEVSLDTTVDELAELRDQLEGLQKLMRHVLESLGG
jgi:hypothetical protein